MRDYQAALKCEQRVLRNLNFKLEGDMLADLVRRFKKLSTAFEDLPVDATDDPQVAAAGETANEKAYYYYHHKQNEIEYLELKQSEERKQ